jgi:hypothetical protein
MTSAGLGFVHHESQLYTLNYHFYISGFRLHSQMKYTSMSCVCRAVSSDNGRARGHSPTRSIQGIC